MTTRIFRFAPLALVALIALAVAPASAQSGNQSDITGVNTTSSGTSTSPTPAPIPTGAITGTQQSLASGTFSVDGVPAPAEVQAALADILSGNVDTPAVAGFSTALGPAGTLVAEALAVFAQAPSVTSLNAAIDAFNGLLDGASPALMESPEFQTTFAVLTTLRSSFGGSTP